MDSSVSLIVPIMVPINGDDMKYWTARAKGVSTRVGTNNICQYIGASIDTVSFLPLFAH